MSNFSIKIKQFFTECKSSPNKAIAAVICAAAAVVLAVLLAVAFSFFVKAVLPFLLGGGVLILIFSNFWEDLFTKLGSKEQPPVLFPVYLAFENGRILPHLADEIFHDLYGRFEACHYVNFCESANRLVYSFKCIPRRDMPVDYDFIQLLQRQTEGILSRELSMNGWNPANCQDMTAVDILHDTMYITFAKNMQGVSEVISIQNSVRQKYLDDHTPSSGGLTDRWED